MKATQLVATLAHAIREYGDLEIYPVSINDKNKYWIKDSSSTTILIIDDEVLKDKNCIFKEKGFYI